MFQRLASTFAGHFNQTKFRNLGNLGLSMIPFQHLFKLAHHLVTVFGFLHVNEVNNDNPAKITQTQLSCNDLCGFHIGLKHSVFQTSSPHIRPRIDINRGHGFGLVNHQVTTRLERHPSLQGFL